MDVCCLSFFKSFRILWEQPRKERLQSKTPFQWNKDESSQTLYCTSTVPTPTYSTREKHSHITNSQNRKSLNRSIVVWWESRNLYSKQGTSLKRGPRFRKFQVVIEMSSYNGTRIEQRPLVVLLPALSLKVRPHRCNSWSFYCRCVQAKKQLQILFSQDR